MLSCLAMACKQNSPATEQLSKIDSLATIDLELDTACIEIDTTTIEMPVKAKDMQAKKPIKLAEISKEEAKIVTEKLMDVVPPEKADEKIKQAAGGAVGDSLQSKFNLLTNDKLDNMQKVIIVKDIQNNFLDKTTDRVSGRFVGEAKLKYGIVEYLRRIKMTNSRKVHIKDIKVNAEGKIEYIIVEELDESKLN